MGTKRIIDVCFWNDDKVVDLFSPEDKLFFLYLMTNPHTTQLGIYQVSKKIMAFEIGYSVDAISVLIDRFENKYNLIKYSNETNEIAIKNFLRHNIIAGGKPVTDLLNKELTKVKDKSLVEYITNHLSKCNDISDTVNKFISNIYINNNQNTNQKTVGKSYHDLYHDTTHDLSNTRFNRFWEAYPKKQGKGDARKAFDKINPNDELLEKMLLVINKAKQTEQWEKEGHKYIPLPATWLRGERWEDDVSTYQQKLSAEGRVINDDEYANINY